MQLHWVGFKQIGRDEVIQIFLFLSILTSIKRHLIGYSIHFPHVLLLSEGRAVNRKWPNISSSINRIRELQVGLLIVSTSIFFSKTEFTFIQVENIWTLNSLLNKGLFQNYRPDQYIFWLWPLYFLFHFQMYPQRASRREQGNKIRITQGPIFGDSKRVILLVYRWFWNEHQQNSSFDRDDFLLQERRMACGIFGRKWNNQLNYTRTRVFANHSETNYYSSNPSKILNEWASSCDQFSRQSFTCGRIWSS